MGLDGLGHEEHALRRLQLDLRGLDGRFNDAFAGGAALLYELTSCIFTRGRRARSWN